MDDAARLSVLDAYKADLVRLAPNLVAAVFPMMKIYPAESCVRRAVQHGLIHGDTLIVETSSGAMAVALAVVCRASGYPLVIVTDDGDDAPLRKRLEDLGAQVEVVDSPVGVGVCQRARLERLEQIRRRNPNSWWVNHDDNPANPGGYSRFAMQLLDEVGPIDCLVGGVGSGGSMCGTAKPLRAVNPSLTVIGVDTMGSVLFGQPEGRRLLRGIGNSVQPKNLDHSAFDEVHWMTAAEAFAATRRLHQTTTLFRGPTSGASWWVARHWANAHPDATVVCLLPDEGYSYVDTVYDDGYLRRTGLSLTPLPAEPIAVSTPLDVRPAWSFLQWMRRPYAAIVSQRGVEVST